MNFKEIQDRVMVDLEENPAGAGIRFTRASIIDSINDGLQDLADHCNFNEEDLVINLQANTTYYNALTLNERFLGFIRLYNNQTSRWLVPTGINELDSAYPRWEISSGEPERIITRAVWHFGVWPRKTVTSGTITAKINTEPVALAADVDTPGFPQEYHQALVEYAEYDQYCQDKELKKAMRRWAEYAQIREALLEWVQKGRGRMDMDRVSMEV